MSYSDSRANYAEVLDAVVNDADIVMVTRSGKEPAVIISMSEYESLKETDYLLRNPVNAEFLREGIEALNSGRGVERELVE
jgi:antitoxin YefM